MNPILVRMFVACVIVVKAAGHADCMAATPGDLTGPWQLFVDDYLISQSQHAARRYHAFGKHPGNPLIRADRPWEQPTVYLYGTVLPRERAKGYRMWYHAYDASARAYRILYAESDDGLQWVKPELGLVAYDGNTRNNILFQHTIEDHNPQVIFTPWDSDPKKRYRMMHFDYGRTPPDHTVEGYWGSYSADGIHWESAASRPVLPDHGDVGQFVWDPLARQFLGYPKIFQDVRGTRRRCVGISRTEDFENWPATRLILAPDEHDDRWVTRPTERTEFYGMSGFAYESMYIGLLWIFRITDGGNDGPIFVELVSSRDGEHWTRQEGDRPPILQLGPPGSFDSGMVFTSTQPLVEVDTIRLWYGGFNITHGVPDSQGAAAIGLATLRKDGFASLTADGQTAVVTTKPLLGLAGQLHVNVDASSGWLKVEVLDEAGVALRGYGRDDCVSVTTDSVEHQVRWSGQSGLPSRAEPVRLRFLFEKASLYSFRGDAPVRLAAP